MAMFTFFDSSGNDSSASTIYIRLSGAFNTTLSNPYQETTGIFGSVKPGQDASSIGKITGLIGSMYDAGSTALQSSIIKSLGAGGGFLASGGQSGKSQIEFLTRKVFNSFQQLIYQGPKFRAFQLPFNMKPTSYAEATTMRDIIQTFRIASSPRGRGSDTPLDKEFNSRNKEEQDAFDTANKDKADDDKIIEFTIANANELLSFGELGDDKAPLTFGYPDMCKLELVLYHNNNDGVKLITPVFKSDFCMIENVVLDYGASNKMVFLSNPEAAEAGDYFPSEISMTISLRESVLVTAEYASGQNGPGITIF